MPRHHTLRISLPIVGLLTLAAGCVAGSDAENAEPSNALESLLTTTLALSADLESAAGQERTAYGVLERYGHHGMTSRALELLETLPAHVERGRAEMSFGRGLIDAGHYAAAAEAIEAMELGRWRDLTARQLVGALSEAGQCDEATRAAGYLDPDAGRDVGLSLLALCHMEAGDWDYALALAGQISEESDRLDAALEPLSRMLEAGAQPDELASEFPEAALVAMDIRAIELAELGACDDARELLSSAEPQLERHAALLQIARCYYDAGSLNSGDVLVTAARNLPDPSGGRCARVARLAEAAALLLDLDLTDRATAVVEEALGFGSCCENGGLDRSLIELGQLDLVLSNLTACSEDWLWSRSRTQAQVASHLASLGEHGRALQVAESIERESVRRAAIHEVASTLVTGGELHAAQTMAARFSEPPSDPTFALPLRDEILRMVHWNMMEHGRVDDARELLDDLDGVGRSGLMGDHAYLLSQRGQFEAATTVIEALPEPARRWELLADIALHHVSQRDYDEASFLVERLPPADRDNALAVMAEQHARDDRLVAAFEAIISMETPTARISTLLRVALYVQPGRRLTSDESELLELVFETTPEPMFLAR